MSKLLENKQMVHIVAEFVVLLGITFYFTQKNKKLMGHLEDLSQRIEEHEDKIKNQDMKIQRLGEHINMMLQQNQQKVQVKPVNHQIETRTQPKKLHTKKVSQKKVVIQEEPSFIDIPISSIPQYSEPEPLVIVEEDEEESEAELDSMIKDELDELEDLDDLKKQQ